MDRGRIDIKALYRVNEEFKEYVSKFARKHELLIDDALKTSVIQNAAEYYEAKEVGVMPDTKINIGCGGSEKGC